MANERRDQPRGWAPRLAIATAHGPVVRSSWTRTGGHLEPGRDRGGPAPIGPGSTTDIGRTDFRATADFLS